MIKAIVTHDNTYVPYTQVVRISASSNGWYFQDSLGTLHQCSIEEGKKYLRSLEM